MEKRRDDGRRSQGERRGRERDQKTVSREGSRGRGESETTKRGKRKAEFWVDGIRRVGLSKKTATKKELKEEWETRGGERGGGEEKEGRRKGKRMKEGPVVCVVYVYPLLIPDVLSSPLPFSIQEQPSDQSFSLEGMTKSK